MVNPFSAERWRLLSRHLDRALDLASDDRSRWLAALRAEDASLAAEVEAMLDDKVALEREGFLAEAALRTRQSLAGQTVGAYTLRSEIGQGGMGTVWLADRSDGRFEGVAAVKLLHAGLVGREGEARFGREANFLARLRHPHIAHLIDAGLSPLGQPYLVLEHVDGQRIDHHCDQARLGVEARIRLFLEVLEAVSHAHANLIVHRDLKPSNVLVTHVGQVKLLDFGIAKLLEDAGPEMATLSREGRGPMTPEYAAPEQLGGLPVTTATDVYSLGVLLYLLLTDEHPAGEALLSTVGLVHAVVESEPRQMSQVVPHGALRRRLGGDLDTIVAKALKKDPSERYVSAAALAEDLRRHLEYEPIRARPDAITYRVAKFARRHRTAVSLLALVGLALAAGMAGTVSQMRRARHEAAVARVQRQAAGAQRDFAIRQLWRAEAVNEVNAYLLLDSESWGKSFAPDDMLARADHLMGGDGGSGDENRVELLVGLGRTYLRKHDLQKARGLLERAHQLAKELPSSAVGAKAYCSLAALVAFGDQRRAEALLKDADQALAGEAQLAPTRIFCLLRGREVANQRDDSVTALARIEAARRLFVEARSPSRDLEATLAVDLADSYVRAGRPRQAAAVQEQILSRLMAGGRGGTKRAALALNDRAVALSELGEYLLAEPLFRQALRIDAAGASRTNTMLSLAGLLVELDRHREAEALAEEAQVEARRLGNQEMIGRAAVVRAAASRKRGDLARAAALIDDPERIYRDLFGPSHLGRAATASERAQQAQSRGDFDGARSELDRAVEIAGASARGRAVYRPRYLRRRAELELARGRFPAAATDARRAIAEMTATCGPEGWSSELGHGHLALGRALAGQGKATEAKAALASAVRHFGPTVGANHAATVRARTEAAGEVIEPRR